LEIVTKNDQQVAIIDITERISNVQEILDLMASAQYQGSSGAMVVWKESLGEGFFDLKTGFAGEVLQKFSNYHVRLAIVGDFSIYKSKVLRGFMYECNKGNLVFFKNSLEEALEALAPGC